VQLYLSNIKLWHILTNERENFPCDKTVVISVENHKAFY